MKMDSTRSIRVVFAQLALFAIGCAHTETPTRPQQENNDQINRFRSEIPGLLKEDNIPGLALAVFDANQVLWEEGFGYTDRSERIEVTPGTPFSVQSTSKTVTATALLIAVDEGLLNLDTPIKQYLADFAVHSRFGRDPMSKMTLRHLLSHTAGFTHEAPIGNNFEPASPSFAEHVRSISQTWLRYPVGQRYSYSNLGIDLAAHILERMTGRSLNHYVQQKLFQPLGMRDSSFDPKIIGERADRALGHSNGYTEVPWDVPMQAAGGLYTSASDLARFVQLHLNGGTVNGRSLVSTKTLSEMYRIPFPVNGQVDGYGLGVGVRHRNGLLYHSHGGGGFGFLSDMMWYPTVGIGIVLLTNSVGHKLQGELAHKILDAFIASRGVAEQQEEPADAQMASEPKSEFDVTQRLGSYMGRFGEQSIRERDDGGQELCLAEKCSPIRYNSETALSVMQNDRQEVFRFVMPAEGQPPYMVRVRDGETWDLNAGPNDPSGPASESWKSFLGKYQIMVWGKPAHTAEVMRKNGYLYLDSFRLSEYEPGLFFDCNGEAVDFRASPPTVANIPLLRVNEK